MQKQHFNNLIFNPFGIPDDELLEQCTNNPKLFNLLGADDGIVGDKSRNRDESYRARLVRYVFYMYDKESPLWTANPDIVDRKKAAALLAGFDIIGQKDTLEKIFNLDDIFLTNSVVSFIQYQHSNDLSALIVNEQSLYAMQASLLEHMDDFKDDKAKVDHFKTKAALMKSQDEILELNEKYKARIWRDDKEAYEKTMDIGFGRATTPEKIAKIKLKGKILE